MTDKEREAYQDMFSSEGLNYGFVKVKSKEKLDYFIPAYPYIDSTEQKEEPFGYVYIKARQTRRTEDFLEALRKSKVQDIEHEVVESKITR